MALAGFFFPAVNLKVREPEKGSCGSLSEETVRRLVGSLILAALGVRGRCLRVGPTR